MKSEIGGKLVPVNSQELSVSVDSYSKGLTRYLDNLGLPAKNVLVSVREREKVLANMHISIESLPPESRLCSYYVSKFVAACGAGLFDAALNFIWDETIRSLREKVTKLDLEYFFDSVITNADQRKQFSKEEDLVNLSDWELIRGCHLTGILSDIGFRHLDYIRDMRNWASAAHPNQNELTGLQLVTWLETCVKEVIGREPSSSAIEIKRLLQNIRTHTLDEKDVAPICKSIAQLPPDLAASLLRTIFGMFTDPKISVSIKNNIRLIAISVWNKVPEETKYEIGIKYSNYAENADIPRRDATEDFLTTTNGLSYLRKDTLALKMNEAVSELFQAHIGFNNFYTEQTPAKALAKYIPENGLIPDSVRYPYVKTIIMCYVGNGYGVSRYAYPYYETLIKQFQDPEIYTVIKLLSDEDFSSRMQLSNCRGRYRSLLQELKQKTSQEFIRTMIGYIMKQTDAQFPNIGKTSEFTRLIGSNKLS
jgi:hypothetical protein